MSERYFEPSAMDGYFEKQDKPTVFLVLGKGVVVDNEQLATALSLFFWFDAAFLVPSAGLSANISLIRNTSINFSIKSIIGFFCYLALQKLNISIICI